MFLIATDYDLLIQADNLSQIVNSNLALRDKMQIAAQAEMISYLAQRYDVGIFFRDTLPFSFTAIYKAGMWVYLDGSAYNALTVYTPNDVLLSNGYVYYKNSNLSSYVAGILATNTSYFTLLGKQYDFFYIFYPAQIFDNKKIYSTGDTVFWKDKVYTSISGSLCNMPDNKFYWGTGIPFSVTGFWPTNTSKWSAGDFRNQQILLYLIDITLFHLHRRIAPRNIPQHREDAYDRAIAWLKMAGRGEITADLPILSPEQGSRLRSGGSPKNINTY